MNNSDSRCSHRGHRRDNQTKWARNNGRLVSSASVLFVLQLLSSAHVAKATISFLDSGRSFHSRVDESVGQPLLRGFQYMGRLQYLSENPQLCPNVLYPNQKYDIVTPTDGLPVALVATAGGCTVYDKIRVASQLINPPNTVAYLILQAPSKRHHLELSSESGSSSNKLKEWGKGLDPGTFYDDIVDSDASEPYYVSLESLQEGLESAEKNGRALLEKQQPWLTEDAIEPAIASQYDDEPVMQQAENLLGGPAIVGESSLAVLRVSYSDGAAIAALAVQGVSFHDRQHGGARILLDAKENTFETRTVVMWMLITISCCACFCACMLLCVQGALEPEEPEPPAPRRPTRRKLTLEEVRTRFPSYIFDPADPTGQLSCIGASCGHSSPAEGGWTLGAGSPPEGGGYTELHDECTICLDEFAAGQRVRRLPCGHVFHSTCIARWLIERSAVCPLCKLDLYVEEEESDSDDDEEEEASPEPNSFWERLLMGSSEGYTPLEVATGAAEEEGTNNEEAPRSWWPFSVEIGPPADEEETPRGGRSPISTAASVLSSFWNSAVTGRVARRRHRGVSEESSNNLTELTEPLVASSASQELEDISGGSPASSPTSTESPGASVADAATAAATSATAAEI